MNPILIYLIKKVNLDCGLKNVLKQVSDSFLDLQLGVL